jgi:polar amino acid transport system permease protein
MTVVDSSPSTSPAAIDAVPLRHPWRWVAAIVIVIVVALFLYGAATNDAYRWPVFAEYLFNKRVMLGVSNTLQLTVYSMVLAIVLGVVLAVMRLSDNPVFRSVSWVYLWIFRGTPIYWVCRSARHSSIWTYRPCLFPFCWRRSAWPSTRPRTWPKSSAPE